MSEAPLRELSLFSGGGGGLLGSHLLGWQIMGMAEWANCARAILEARIADGSLPDVTIHRDVQELDPTEYIGKVDIVTGGFPCQPFSIAGKRLGAEDPRNMWPHTIRILKGTQAPYGFFENVGALLSSGYFGAVLGDLTAAGFDVAWDDVPASAVGAPHLRSRLWIYARKRTGDEPDTREIPLKRIATMGSEGWKRLTGHGSWSDETDHGEPAKWPRSGVVLGGVAYQTPRAAFPKGIPKRYGVWPHVRLSWAKKAPLDAESRFQKVWTTPRAGEARTYTLPSSAVVRGSLTGDMAREYSPHGQGYFEGEDAPAEHDRMWNTPTAHDSKMASLPPAGLARDSLAGDMTREHGVNGRTFVGHEDGMWPNPVASDAKGANLSFSDTMSANNLPTTAIREEAAKTGTDASYKMGMLNPEWVAWLMGWPIGWTSPEPLPEGNLETWMELSRGRSWWRSEPEGVPRLTHKGTEAGSRANRLKALGNGQVSLCCARSYEVLKQTLDLCYTQAEQDEEPVGLDALFGF